MREVRDGSAQQFRFFSRESFLEFSGSKLRQLTGRIENCIAKLEPGPDLGAPGPLNQNAVGGILLLHLAGNVRQWIVCAVGGAPDQRDRDSEFSAVAGISGAELLDRLRTNVGEAIEVISGLPPKRLSDRVNVQGYDVTVLEAVYHVPSTLFSTRPAKSSSRPSS